MGSPTVIVSVLVESPSGNVDIFLDRVQRGQGDPIWLFSSGTLQEIPRLYDEIQPPWIERYVPERLRTIRWLSIPLYRWIAILLFIPLFFGLAALSTRALTGLLRPVFRRLTREQDDRRLASRGPLRLLVARPRFSTARRSSASASPPGTSGIAWPQTLMVMALCWLSLRLMDVVAELSLKRLQRVNRSGDTALVRLINRLSEGDDGDRRGAGSPLSFGRRSHGRAHRAGRRRPGDWLRRPEND